MPALQETPHGLTKVYVDYLPRSNDGLEPRLERFFGCGKIIKMLKKSGKTFGYVIFKKPNSARVALQKDGMDFDGKRIRVELPRGIVAEGSAADATGDRPSARTRGQKGPPNRLPEHQVYISHLAKPVNPEILRSIISDEAPHLSDKVEHIKMMGTKNCCFVTLQSTRDVQDFCEKFNEYPLLGQNLQALPAVKPGLIKEEGAIPEAYKLENYGSQAVAREEEEEKPKQMPKRSKAVRSNAVVVDDTTGDASAYVDPWAEQDKRDRENTERQKQMVTIGSCRSVLAGLFREDVKQGEVKEVFKRCGRIIQLRLMRNRVTGAFTGVVAIRFDKAEAVYRAVQLAGSESKLTQDGQLSVDVDQDESKAQPAQPAAAPAAESAAPTPTPQAAPAKKRRAAKRGLVVEVAGEAVPVVLARSSRRQGGADVDSDEEILDSDDDGAAAPRPSDVGGEAPAAKKRRRTAAVPAEEVAAPSAAGETKKGKKKKQAAQSAPKESPKAPPLAPHPVDEDDEDALVEVSARG
eukprot:TRINITY_DN11472_c0_g1_i1.p1 TRINITY_DN11472_c0_g1~~TRINITY_DN11472_c0_g1_i1.p1  ORF type:complete len:521 (+),score=231.51 TRINITY_DN11472_c0_g1_i1:265-1827(+)